MELGHSAELSALLELGLPNRLAPLMELSHSAELSALLELGLHYLLSPVSNLWLPNLLSFLKPRQLDDGSQHPRQLSRAYSQFERLGGPRTHKTARSSILELGNGANG